ncbi:MAG: hypothetical protein R3F45_15970 [Gammaproteobacteria bacterium]
MSVENDPATLPDSNPPLLIRLALAPVAPSMSVAAATNLVMPSFMVPPISAMAAFVVPAAIYAYARINPQFFMYP